MSNSIKEIFQKLQKKEDRLKRLLAAGPTETDNFDTFQEDMEWELDRVKKSFEFYKKFYKTDKPKKHVKPLKPTEQSIDKPFRYLTFDIETENWKDFLCLGFYDIENDYYEYGESLEEIIVKLVTYCKEHSITSVIAHNGGKFDFMFILEGIFRNKISKDFEFRSAIPRGSGFLKIEIYYKPLKKKILLRDSLSFIPASLKKAGEAYKVETPKEEIDYVYLGEAFRNENYIKKLFTETVEDIKGNSTLRHIVYLRDRKIKDYTHLIRENSGKEPRADKITYMLEDEYYENKKNHKFTPRVFRIYNKEDVKHYLKIDCICLAQIIRNHANSPIIKDAGLAFTSAGQAIKIFQRYLDYTIWPSKPEEDAFVRKAYLGGRTELFKHYFNGDYDLKENPENFDKETLKILKKQKGKKIKCFDANSLYPTVMSMHLYPIDFAGMGSGQREYDRYEYCVWHVKVKVPDNLAIPPLGIQHTFEDKTSKLVFPVGEFEGYWTKFELEYAKTLGVEILEYYEGACFGDGKPLFKNFIEKMYTTRLEARKNGDSTTAEICKLAMNSCYGKLGQSSEGKDVIIPYEGHFFQEEIKIFTENKNDFALLCKLPSETSSMFSKVVIACYVTSYARVFMHKQMMGIGAENIFYTDTDSLFTTEDMLCGDSLGQMKLEYEYTSACFLLPKTYTVFEGFDKDDKSKKVIKGFDKQKREGITPREFFEYWKGDIAEIKAINKEKFMSHGEAFKNGVFLGLSRDVSFEEKNTSHRLAQANRELEKALKKKDKKLIQSLKGKVKSLQVKLDEVGDRKYKSIRKKYDKRLPHANKIDTVPIKLGVNYEIF